MMFEETDLVPRSVVDSTKPNFVFCYLHEHSLALLGLLSSVLTRILSTPSKPHS